jgi:hypothetical protein
MSASIVETNLETLHREFVSLVCGAPIKNPKIIEESTGGKIDPSNGENIDLETAKVVTTVLAYLRDETASVKKRGPGRGRRKATAPASDEAEKPAPKRRGRRKKSDSDE